MASTQSFKNHTRWHPIFHFFIAPVLLLNIVAVGIWYNHHRDQHAHSGPWAILVAVALFLLALTARMYAIKVQDRLIRLEERIRLSQLCSPEQLAELEPLILPQYIALRFASDAELPSLALRAVQEKLDRKQIKEAIVTWRPDTDRV